MLKIFLTVLCSSICIILFSGCFSGFSRLPEINFIGKSREETVKIFASNPEKTWGTHIRIGTPSKNTPPYYCDNNLYFKTVEEALSDKRIQNAPALRGYFTTRFLSTPKATGFFEVTFDRNDKVIRQETSYYQDAM